MYGSRLQITKLLPTLPRIAEKHELWNCEAGRQGKIILLLFRSKLYYKRSVYAWETLSYTEGMC